MTSVCHVWTYSMATPENTQQLSHHPTSPHRMRSAHAMRSADVVEFLGSIARCSLTLANMCKFSQDFHLAFFLNNPCDVLRFLMKAEHEWANWMKLKIVT